MLMLSTYHKSLLQEYIINNNVSQRDVEILKKGNDGDAEFLVQKGMELSRVIQCIKANLECAKQLNEPTKTYFKQSIH